MLRYNRSTPCGRLFSLEWIYELNGQEYEFTVLYDKNYNIVSLSSDGDAEFEKNRQSKAPHDQSSCESQREFAGELHGNVVAFFCAALPSAGVHVSRGFRPLHIFYMIRVLEFTYLSYD